MPKGIPAEWLPQACVPVTIVWTHPDYDSMVETIACARDWAERGDDYLRSCAHLDEATIIVAAFPGDLRSLAGCAVNA